MKAAFRTFEAYPLCVWPHPLTVKFVPKIIPDFFKQSKTISKPKKSSKSHTVKLGDNKLGYNGKGSERQKSLHQKSKKEHRKSKI